MAIKPNQCYKCNDRELGCHAKCQKYISWVKEREEAIKDYKTHLSTNELLYGYISENRSKNMKKKHLNK